ncbi:hypothetical protein HK098_000817 [Nowakowskiella sp. JEL0407]|nr:hypothetical protein HK098_000817 [Nowakowskiella sp. JEL0407]
MPSETLYVSKKSSLAFVLDSSQLRDKVNFIRNRYDTAQICSRWPAHINLIYPFAALLPKISIDQVYLSLQQELLVELQAVCAKIEPFVIRFNRINTFHHKSGGITIFLEPAGNFSKDNDRLVTEDIPRQDGFKQLVDLQTKLDAVFQKYAPNPRQTSENNSFHPHLTLGNLAKNNADKLETIIEHMKSIFSQLESDDFNVMVDGLSIMTRDSEIHLNENKDRFFTVYRLVLGNDDPKIFEIEEPIDHFYDEPLKREKKKKVLAAIPALPISKAIQYNASNKSSNISDSKFISFKYNVSIVSYNVLNSATEFDIDDSDVTIGADSNANRWTNISKILGQCDADVIVLQECTTDLESKILSSSWISEKQYTAGALNQRSENTHGYIFVLSKLQLVGSVSYEKVVISQGKTAIFSDFLIKSSSEGPTAFAILRVAGVHLSSDYSRNKFSKRVEQLQKVTEILSQDSSNGVEGIRDLPIIGFIVGDFNDDQDVIIPDGFVDVSASSGPTYNVLTNPYAKATAQNKKDRPYRLDRAALRFPVVGDNSEQEWKMRMTSWNAHATVFADGRENSKFKDNFIASDHFALNCRLQFSVLQNEVDAPALAADFKAKLNVINENLFEERIRLEFMFSNVSVSDSNLATFLSSQSAKSTRTTMYQDILATFRSYIRCILPSDVAKSALYIVPTGSFALGSHIEGESDLDMLCCGLIGWKDFVRDLVRHQDNTVKLLRVVDTAKVPVIEFSVNNVKIDLQYACVPDLFNFSNEFKQRNQSKKLLPEVEELAWYDYIDELILTFYKNVMLEMPVIDQQMFDDAKRFMKSLPAASYPSIANRFDSLILLGLFALDHEIKETQSFRLCIRLSSFQLARKYLRQWAKSRGIFEHRFGYIGGYTLSVLCAKVCRILDSQYREKKISEVPNAATIISAFFKIYSKWIWSEQTIELFPRLKSEFVAKETVNFPMTVLQMSPLNPINPQSRGNATRNATKAAVQVWDDELKRAAKIVGDKVFVESGKWIEEVSIGYPFLTSHPYFIRVDIFSPSNSQFNSICTALEAKLLIAILLDISRAIPDTYSRVWPHRLKPHQSETTSSTDTDVYEGFYLIGLGKSDKISYQNQMEWETRVSHICTKFNQELDQLITEKSSTAYIYLTSRQTLTSEFPNLSTVFTLQDKSKDSDPQSPDTEKIYEIQKLDKDTEPQPISKEPKIKGKGNIRSSQDVYNRIVWDPRYDVMKFVIGYEDRFTGIQEIPFSVFQKNRDKGSDGNSDWIPFHRVWYFKMGEEFVWDRRSGVDLLFGEK